MVPQVSPSFRSMTLKNKNKFKVFAAPRLNQITIPSQIVLCKFPLINSRHQRLTLFEPDCAQCISPTPTSLPPVSLPVNELWVSICVFFFCVSVFQQVYIGFLVKTSLLLFPYIQYCQVPLWFLILFNKLSKLG